MSKTNIQPTPKRNRSPHHWFLALFVLTASLMISTHTPRTPSAIAGPPQQGQVEVIPASRVATSTHPLRGMPHAMPESLPLVPVEEGRRLR